MSQEGAVNGILTKKVNDLLKRLAASEQRRKEGQRLLAEVADYATHAPSCPFPRTPTPPKNGTPTCDCGLFDLLKKCTKL